MPIDDQKFERSAKRRKGILLDEQQWMYIKSKYNLSSREVQAAILLCRGFSNEEIANALDIKPGTVKTHLRNLYRSFQVNGKVLLILAIVDDVIDHFYARKISPPVHIPIQELPSKPDSASNLPVEEQKHS
jgi:DNA-binding CsgD family transcriptional regulator